MSVGNRDRPSPSDIFKTPEWIWTPDAAYDSLLLTFPDGSNGWRFRIKKEHLLIPFTIDPFAYAYPIPGTLSQDPLFDKEHHLIYLDGADPTEHSIMVKWLASEWQNPPAGQKPRGNIIYYDIPGKMKAVHRLVKIEVKNGVRQWWFRGDNNFMWFIRMLDPYPALDEQIKWLVCSIIY